MPRSILEWARSMSSADTTEISKSFLPAGFRQGVCYTYLLKCADGSLYCGWTNNLEERVRTHNAGQGAKYTRSRLPARLVYWEHFDTKQEAMRREWHVKQMSRKEKIKMIRAERTEKEEKDG